jgi:hypothetical protein
MKHIAIVEVDETLWGFNIAVHTFAKEMGVKLPPTRECIGWDAIYKYAGKEAVTKVFDAVHAQQCSFKPFPDAKRFLAYLGDAYSITIASNRKPQMRQELVDWLDMNELIYNDVIIAHDKVPLLKDPRVRVVVDDNAEFLMEAIKEGKLACGLRRPWNENAGLREGILFYDLPTILDHINKTRRNDVWLTS